MSTPRRSVVADQRISWRCQAVDEKDEKKSLLTFFCPLLKLFADPDPTAPRNKVLETASTGFASIARLPWGKEVSPVAAARGDLCQPPPTHKRLFDVREHWSGAGRAQAHHRNSQSICKLGGETVRK
eukprot:3648158-Rhodomonas_salina.1